MTDDMLNAMNEAITDGDNAIDNAWNNLMARIETNEVKAKENAGIDDTPAGIVNKAINDDGVKEFDSIRSSLMTETRARLEDFRANDVCTMMNPFINSLITSALTMDITTDFNRKSFMQAYTGINRIIMNPAKPPFGITDGDIRHDAMNVSMWMIDSEKDGKPVAGVEGVDYSDLTDRIIATATENRIVMAYAMIEMVQEFYATHDYYVAMHTPDTPYDPAHPIIIPDALTAVMLEKASKDYLAIARIADKARKMDTTGDSTHNNSEASEYVNASMSTSVCKWFDSDKAIAQVVKNVRAWRDEVSALNDDNANNDDSTVIKHDANGNRLLNADGVNDAKSDDEIAAEYRMRTESQINIEHDNTGSNWMQL